MDATGDKAVFLKRKLQHAKEVFSERSCNKRPCTVSRNVSTGQEVHACQVPELQKTDSAPVSSPKFHNKTLQDLLFVEIYAGTARLSRVARDQGLGVLPIDKTAARASQIFVANYDVTSPEEFAAMMELLDTEKDRILGVHLAPACGTASKAREKKLTKYRNKGFNVPGPLRSRDKPMGLDALGGLDKVGTEAANLVYAATATVMTFCIKHAILCSLENPENSLFWAYPDIETILAEFGGFSVFFQHCMHGGNRNKKTRWWSTEDVFQSLAATCDGKHKHATWNPRPIGSKLSFPTAEEAAYPFLLCQRVVAILVQYAMQHGASKPESLQDEIPRTANTSHRWILDMLPKGKKLQPLVSEFQSYVRVLLADPAVSSAQVKFT